MAKAWWESFFDKEMGEVMVPEQAWQQAEELCGPLLQLLNLQPGAKILDLACGPGRFALPLAKRGFCVVGFDLASVYLEQARKKAQEQGLFIELVQGDMREIPFEDEFDAVINMFTSFGYFDDERDHLKVLQGVHKSLKPGGRFLMDTINREWLIRHFQPHDWQECSDFILLEDRKFNAEGDRVEAKRIKLSRDGQRREYTLSLRFFTLAELLNLFSQAGLKVLGYYGDLMGNPWDWIQDGSS
ncbi:MAG: class I SAM-dependent methyltransferase [Armatimonadota bacterium]|nr:class I SAM-dependent methyltransferase [Armatimonadota bacterium]